MVVLPVPPFWERTVIVSPTRRPYPGRSATHALPSKRGLVVGIFLRPVPVATARAERGESLRGGDPAAGSAWPVRRELRARRLWRRLRGAVACARLARGGQLRAERARAHGAPRRRGRRSRHGRRRRHPAADPRRLPARRGRLRAAARGPLRRGDVLPPT